MKMLNMSEHCLDSFRSSDFLLQPLWDYLLHHHHSLISSPFFPVLVAFCSYVIFSVPFTFLDLLGDKVFFFHQFKIQQNKRPTVGMMMKSFSTALYNHVVFVLPSVLITMFILPTPTLPHDAPSLYKVFIDGLAVLLLFDTQYFIWHYVHHKNSHLYRWIHAVHHQYTAPFSWSTEQLSIPELMTVGFWSNQDPLLLRVHPLTTWCVTVFSIWLSVEDHIGYDLPWALNHVLPCGLLGGAPAHDLHHQRPNRNYAPFFRHWDTICGTAAVPLSKNK